MKKEIKSDLGYLLTKIVIIGIILLIMFGALFGLCRDPDDSMYPAVRSGDLIVYYRLQKNYHTGDVIVLKQNDEIQLRRIVAIGGDTVDLTDEGLIINGYHQQETGIYTDTLPFKEGISFPVTLKKGQVFVLSDNRDEAADSRIYGPVDIENTGGVVLSVIRRRGI